MKHYFKNKLEGLHILTISIRDKTNNVFCFVDKKPGMLNIIEFKILSN